MSYADFRKKFGLEEETKAPSTNNRSDYESFRKSHGLDTDLSGIDGNFINTFLSDAQNYLNGAHSAYTGMGYANRESVFASQKQKSDDLRSRSGKIRAYLNGNKASLKEDDYNSLIALLDDFDNSSAYIYDAFSKKNEGISQFASEYAYTEFLRQNELEGMTADEIQAARGSRVSDEDKGIIHELMLSNMPYSREYAQQDGRDMGLYNEVEQKRKYISDKYGVNLYEDIYNNGKIFTDLLNDDVIAYTTMDGRNVTWDSLLQNAQQSEDLANRLSTYSANADWGEKSQKIQTVADTESDYSIVYEVLQANVPYDWKTAEANGIDRETFDAIERKRRYISEKYGVDLYSDIYGNFDALSSIMAELDGQEGEKDTFENLSYLTRDEKAVLSYIYETEGRAAALAWHNSRMNIYDERFREGVATSFESIGKDSPFWGSVGSVALSLGSGAEYLTDIFNYMVTGEEPYNTMALASSSIRSGVMEKVDWEIGNWDAFDFVYGAGMSMADSVAAMATMGNYGGLGLGISAAAQATNDALARGMSNKQAFWNGLVSGTFECLFESWSIGNFQALKEVASVHGRDIAKNIAKSMLVNASEETLTELSNIVYDAVFNGDFSQYETRIRQYMAMGMTEAEATKKVIYEHGVQVAEAGASGALMGFGFGAAGSGRAIAHNVASSAQSAQQTYNIGKQIRDAEGGIDALSSLAAEVAGADSKLSGRAKNLNGDVATGTGLGKVVAGAKNMGKNWKAGQVYRGVEFSVTAQTKTDVAAALQEAGLSKRSANHLADAVVANMNGKQLTNFQRSTLDLYEGNEKVGAAISKAVAGTEQRIGEFAKDITAGRISKATGTSLDVAKKAVRGEAYTTYDVSADGVTTDKDGNAINIDGVESTENGKLLLKTENGTIDSGDVVYASEADALVYEAVANMGATPASAWAMIKAATEDGGVSATEYATAAPLAYLYGKLGYEKGVFSNGKPRLSLTETQSATAYQMGRSDAEASVKATSHANTKATISKKNADKEIIFEGFTYSKRKANPVQRASMEAIELINKVSSLEVHVYRSVKENGKYYAEVGGKKRIAPNGYFMDGNKIFIDINAGKDGRGVMLFTMAHEIGHYIAQNNAADFKAISDFLFEHYGEDAPIYEELRKKKQTLIDSYKRDGKLVPEKAQLEKEAQEELVCDMLSRMLADQHAYDKLMELKQENLNAFQKLGEAIKKFLDKIAKFIGIYDTQVTDFQMAASVETFGEEVFRQLQDLYIKAFVQADANFHAAQAQKNTTEDGGVKYSQKGLLRTAAQVEVTARYQSAVDQVLKMQNTKPDHLVIGYTPDVYTSLGMPSLPFVIGTGHVYSAAKTEAEAKLEGNYRKGINYHGLGADVVKNIYEALKDPIMIIASKDVNKNATPLRSTHSVVAIVDVGNSQKSLLLPVEITAERSVNGARMDVNALSSVYERDVTPLIGEAIALENTGDVGVYYAKKEALTLPGAGVQFPIQLQQSIASNGIIHRFSEKVNMNVSDATQSQQFKRWFGDWQNHPAKASKVVNADGTPKVVYHGTSADFAIFDKRKAKEGAFGRGFYFATSNGRAKAYGSGTIMETYLSIKTPYIVHDSLGFTGEDYRNMQKQFGLQDKITDKNVGKVLQQQGYDGIMVYDGNGNVKEIVAFEPTQIKSATDNIGTFDGSNPDIRYSDRDYSYEALASKPDMVVTTVGGNVPNNRADVVHQAKKNAAKVGKFNPKDGSVSVHVDDIDADVVVGTAGLKHSLDRRFNVNAPVTLQAGLILQNSIQINELTPQHPNAQSSYVLIGAAKTKDGQLYIVRSVVNRFSQELTSMDVLYAFNGKTEPDLGKKKETGRETIPNGPQLNTATITGSTISIAELLDHVNQYFPDILPEDVLKHYGYDARPDGDLGQDALYQERTEDSVSNRSLLANAFEGVAQNEVERSKIQEYRDKVALMDAEERKLIELNNQIKELSFAKGPRDTKKIRGLQLEARKIANRISIYDKQLLRLEASKPLQDVLAREKKAAYKRAEKKGKEALEAYREKALKQQKELTAKWQESRKRGIESRNKTAMRHKIKGVVNELNQYLLHGTKERHVPVELQKAVAEALDAVNMDTVGAEERIAKLEADLLKAKTPEQIQEISRKIDHIREMGDRMNGRLQKLKDAYDQFVNSDDPLIANSHDEVISNKLQAVIDSVGDTALRDMSLSQLEDVYDMYRMVLTTIRNANKAFKAKKSESITAIATEVMSEVEQAGGKKKQSLAMFNWIKEFGWNNLKPVYAFEHIGSDHFTEVFNNVRAGEDVWAVDVTEARAFYLDKAKKHNYNSWDFGKRYRFESSSGMTFELGLEQIMSLYAYSKRDQAADHLRKGGIVFDESTKIVKKTKVGLSLEFNPTEATAYNISTETLDDIVSKLTEEQRAFVDEMQEYLSTVMGEKGNEVSLEMYGVKLFKEKHYFPLRSAQQFMARAKEQQKGEVKIKNSGFSKETVQKASNPIVLTPFMNVWADHVNEMSMYHAFVLPMEDLYRVYNFKTATSETEATESVEMFIQNAYGKGATKYLDQLLKDLNGGARVDSTTGIINKGIGLFKKGAVFASLSVVVQQPSAIARALALVDIKYFIGPKVDHKRHTALWDEVKKYAPVAIIKEMGYFDTNMGKSTQDFITGKEYGSFKEKMAALVKDSNYRDEVLSKAPSFADEIAWCGIWEAVKREQKAKNPGMDVKSEAFLKMAGDRFTEVIVKTQVYDSVLSRSGMMRSKDTGMKMATAFMAEPTTSINMVADALLQGKRGNRKYARTAIGAVIASQILNAILVSFVYAGRDDDEDETYLEKYIGTFTGEVIDSLNPAGYIPFLKDIVSIVQGYEVERSDMAVISDLWKAWENLGKDNVSVYRKVEGFAGSIAQIFGLPLKNIMRDARGIYQTVMSFVDGEHTTATGIGHAVKSALPAWIGGGDVPNEQQLYEAYLNGDEDQIARLVGRYEDESAVNSAMRSAIKEHYAEGDISSEAAISYLVEYAGMEEDDAYWKLQEWEYESVSEDEFGKYNKFYEAVQTGKNLKAVIKEYTDNGVEMKSLKSRLTSHFKPMYIDMSNAEKSSVKGYLLNAYELCGYDRTDAADLLAEWEYESNHPDLVGRITYSQYKRWQTDGKPRGASIELFTDVAEFRDGGTSGSTKSQEEVAAYINSLSISITQKDALWCCFWKESTLKNAPWH